MKKEILEATVLDFSPSGNCMKIEDVESLDEHWVWTKKYIETLVHTEEEEDEDTVVGVSADDKKPPTSRFKTGAKILTLVNRDEV